MKLPLTFQLYMTLTSPPHYILIENSIFDDVTAKITSVPQVGMEDDATAHLTYRNVRLCLYCVGHSWLTFVQGWKFALWYFEQSALLFFVSEIAK